MLMFARALQRRSDAAGWGVASLAAHPGWARTELFDAEPGAGQGKGIETWGAKLILPLLGQSAAQGALPTLFAATAAQAAPGGYYGPAGWLELKGAPAPAIVSAAARDETAGDRLWAMSEAMAGVAFPAAAT